MMGRFFGGAVVGLVYMTFAGVFTIALNAVFSALGDVWGFVAMGAVIVVLCGLLAMKSGSDK